MAMLLKSDDGAEFELALIEERLPDVQDGFGDAAPLTITFRVATQNEAWEETSPCLNTFEVRTLLDWLEAVGGGTPDEAEVELLQPGLRFLVIKDQGEKVTLRIGFDVKDRPEELVFDAPTDADHVDLKLDRSQIRAAAESLRRDMGELGRAEKDDLAGDDDLGGVRSPDEDLAILDRIEDEPAGMGEGEDNAGER